jgi:riboflavin synthase
MMLGHVDGVGAVSTREPRGEALRLEVTVPSALARFVAEKGSVTFEGVSLTVNRVGAAGPGGFPCEVMLVPHTLTVTHLGDLRIGARVNVEVDVLARYVARMLECQAEGGAGADQRLLAKLGSSGYL